MVKTMGFHNAKSMITLFILSFIIVYPICFVYEWLKEVCK